MRINCLFFYCLGIAASIPVASAQQPEEEPVYEGDLPEEMYEDEQYPEDYPADAYPDESFPEDGYPAEMDDQDLMRPPEMPAEEGVPPSEFRPRRDELREEMPPEDMPLEEVLPPEDDVPPSEMDLNSPPPGPNSGPNTGPNQGPNTGPNTGADSSRDTAPSRGPSVGQPPQLPNRSSGDGPGSLAERKESKVGDIDIVVDDLKDAPSGSEQVPEGQELVNINFPDPTEIKDIITAVSLWTGKNVILGPGVQGRVQMISPKKVTKTEAYQAFLSALNMLNLTTIETGKVIKIVPVHQAVKSNLKTYIGSNWAPATDNLITQIVPLRYISAEEVQKTLSKMVNVNSLISYPPTNTLIISDTGFKVASLLEIIKLLDVQTQQPQLAVVPIKYGDAKEIAQTVQELVQAKSKAGGGSGGSNYFDYKLTTDDRTNSVVVFGPPRTISDVKKLVEKFDTQVEDPSRQSSIHIRPLDYADATKLASVLSNLASGSSSRAPIRRPTVRTRTRNAAQRDDDNLSPSVAVLDNDVKITSDEASNSLIITGSRAAYDALNSIIRKLDVRRSQVFIEAEVLDLSVDGGFNLSSSIFAGDANKDGSGNKVAYTWEAGGLTNLLTSQVTGSKDTASVGKALQTFGSDFNLGILAGTPVQIPGLANPISPGALIKMIKTDGSTRILASPQMLTLNNEEASFTVGDKLFYKSEVPNAQGIVAESVKTEKVGLALNIKPNISHSNYVTLDIDIDSDSGQLDPGTQLPKVKTRKTKQVVTVKNTQTVVISGLMYTAEEEVFKKIPLLGDIPILGWLFRNSQIKKSKQNLMIFITPHIVHGANDLAAIYEKKMVERDEMLKTIYGSRYERSAFYKKLPTKEDGKHKPDEFDQMDEQIREKRREEILRDLNLSEDSGSDDVDPQASVKKEDRQQEG